MFPLGRGRRHIAQWLDVAVGICRADETERATWPYNNWTSWHVMVRAARLLAHEFKSATAGLFGTPLPLAREGAFAEMEAHRDAIITALAPSSYDPGQVACGNLGDDVENQIPDRDGFDTTNTLRPLGPQKPELLGGLPAVPPVPNPIPTDPSKPTASLLSAAELARALGSTNYRNRVDTALRRHAEQYPACREEVKAPRKGEPRILYRVDQVWQFLLTKLPAWRRSTPTTD